jgi:enterochelin esterase-like enzyme
VTKDNLLVRAQEGTPVIDGNTATFVWQGERPPQLIGDWTHWEHRTPVDLSRVAPGVWAHTLALPGDAYLEYVFWQDGERVADPLNLRTTPNGFGHDNHYFYMRGAAPTPLTRRRRNVPHGTVTRHILEQDFYLVGRRRPVYLYQPPTPDPTPLLVVLDGQDYRRRAKLVHIVDNLIAQERIPPIALAMIHHGGQARGIEYACSDAHLAILIDFLLPLAQKELNLLDPQAHPGAYGILGASMGGLMAFYASLRAPQVFGRVLSQSAACDQDYVLWDLIRHGPTRPLTIWMDVGRYEWLLDANRRLHALLREKGYDVTYREYNGGHNSASWRDDLWRGLEVVFGMETTDESSAARW